ncbi:hypothetical protein DL89DRAFT_263937 [Linderina pennispora]|uniref:Uncharacterized protein n=1 Tax=Linderina pennispora TaxID=61395 RepID=A0A1Y1WK09_9FUNG|nr:uncharacterized protein DL89DRAFT_263937 [Linderina pennispora]ORX73920.1 hypothetical protein DL89DRAFT_263937 [Linderina pennispora]
MNKLENETISSAYSINFEKSWLDLGPEENKSKCRQSLKFWHKIRSSKHEQTSNIDSMLRSRSKSMHIRKPPINFSLFR